MSISGLQRGTPFRFIDDPPSGGAWQMAVDEALLESAAAGGGCTLRFYGWAEPTLSLGYFQDYAGRTTHRASQNCALVRRQTGGGAILHDRELTYSLAINAEHPLAEDALRLYRTVHQTLIETLQEFQIRARLCAGTAPSTGVKQPFLCFQRRTSGDILLGEAKICGSAQRRRRGAVLQHGSLLWAGSPQAPELPGIEELTGNQVNQADFTIAWRLRLVEALGLEFDRRGLTLAEKVLVRSLAVEKYDCAQWNRRR
jgi:lipoyl(octanoyl) transferase